MRYKPIANCKLKTPVANAAGVSSASYYDALTVESNLIQYIDNFRKQKEAKAQSNKGTGLNKEFATKIAADKVAVGTGNEPIPLVDGYTVQQFGQEMNKFLATNKKSEFKLQATDWQNVADGIYEVKFNDDTELLMMSGNNDQICGVITMASVDELENEASRKSYISKLGAALYVCHVPVQNIGGMLDRMLQSPGQKIGYKHPSIGRSIVVVQDVSPNQEGTTIAVASITATTLK